MNENSLWKQFATTGKVQDYLSYCKVEKTHRNVTTVVENEGSRHERDSNSDRDDTYSISHERVR